MKLKAYAKINLYLDIVARLANGYHALHTVMQSVGLYDEIILEPDSSGNILLSSTDTALPSDQSNTAYAAAELFFGASGIKDGVRIHITKNIPSQAGLGGGSADAAAVLYGLNLYYHNRFSENELSKLAAQIGADVPFCLFGGTRLCTGTGTVTAPVPEVSSYCLLCKPETGTSTKLAYQQFDTRQNLIHNDLFLMTQGFYYGQAKIVIPWSYNMFEQLCPVPQGEEITRILTQHNALHAGMTGSGSCYFGMFDALNDAQNAEKAVKASGLCPFTAVTQFVKQGVSVAP